MNRLVEVFGTIVIVASWLAGIVLAQGTADKAIAALIPLYAWYLVVERIMILSGFLN